MDLSCLVTKDSADEGKWFQYKQDGKLYDFGLLIYGEDSDVVTNFSRQQLKKLDVMSALSGKAKEFDEDEVDELLESNDSVICRIGGIKTWSDEKVPVELLGKVLKNDADSYAFMLEKIPAVKAFVLEKSKARKNFLPDMKNPSKNQ